MLFVDTSSKRYNIDYVYPMVQDPRWDSAVTLNAGAGCQEAIIVLSSAFGNTIDPPNFRNTSRQNLSHSVSHT